jgi:oligopeptide/dipeptide ABC transporter ATP-binding protein
MMIRVEENSAVTATAVHDEPPLLEVRDLRTVVSSKRGEGRAVDGVSFSLRPRETLGLVGESGSGKSMTCLSIVRLNPRPASRIVGGQILFRGADLLHKSEDQMRSYRGRHIAMILQDPMTALNPVLTIGEQIYESLRLVRRPPGESLKDRAVRLLRLLHVPEARQRLSSYPHQLSGGTRQRVVGAIALSAQPEILIADEPTTSLDATIQMAYLQLLKSLQRQTGVSIIFVTHDFGVVARMCDRVAVMYAGRIVETGDVRTILTSPAHPYTEALVNSVPDLRARVRRLYSIPGQPPSIFAQTTGCPFAPRCSYVQERCRSSYPPAREVRPGNVVNCWRHVPHDPTASQT